MMNRNLSAPEPDEPEAAFAAEYRSNGVFEIRRPRSGSSEKWLRGITAILHCSCEFPLVKHPPEQHWLFWEVDVKAVDVDEHYVLAETKFE